MQMPKAFQEYLPQNSQVVSESVNGFTMAKVIFGNDILGHGWDKDSRLASINALGEALAYVASEKQGSTADVSFAFGVSQDSAKQLALLKAVRRWAWAQWILKSPLTEASPKTAKELEEISGNLFSQLAVWQTRISFFEPTTAIHQLNFSVATAKAEWGWLIGSAITRDFESPATALLGDLCWHQSILQNADQKTVMSGLRERLLEVRKTDLKAAFIAWQGDADWPPFRMDLFEGNELKGLGWIWKARVEGFEVPRPSTLFLCE